MGMYTELIFGCKLAKYTPKTCIEALNRTINGAADNSEPAKEVADFINEYKLDHLFSCSSYYFGVSESDRKFWFDGIDNCWHISTRSNIKNYDGQIENFLNYIKDYVDQGSGDTEVYAYVQYEEAALPTIYSLKGKFELDSLLHDELVKREII